MEFNVGRLVIAFLEKNQIALDEQMELARELPVNVLVTHIGLMAQGVFQGFGG